ncbi:cytochrome b/b6 domain-containing protein [uncultured Sphingomonas sp.]|uniref:cytochrome b/b6 domain-containing protein n=1 Tax=uncultured Sphingomonas sp. TaxID=158754 RepID=UPI0035CBB84B
MTEPEPSDAVEPPEPTSPAPGPTIYRHRLPTRVWHWVNAVAIFIMIGSGIGILQAHPRLYWGDYGANPDQPWWRMDWAPAWLNQALDLMTIPAGYNLAISRRWHLLFALVLGFALLGFMVTSLLNRHFQRDLRVRAAEMAPRHLLADAIAHLKFRFHNADDATAYNTLQKLAYVAVIFVLIPAMLLTGLAMSPAMDAAWPWLLVATGGRQSARSIHFLAATSLLGFVIVHLVLVILAGMGNEIRSMVTGRWRLPADAHAAPPAGPEPEPAE